MKICSRVVSALVLAVMFSPTFASAQEATGGPTQADGLDRTSSAEFCAAVFTRPTWLQDPPPEPWRWVGELFGCSN